MGKHITKVLQMMCRIAGVDYKKVNFAEQGWYAEHTWNKAQEYSFCLWFELYLYNNAEARREIMQFPIKDKKKIKKFVAFFNMSHGWRIHE